MVSFRSIIETIKQLVSNPNKFWDVELEKTDAKPVLTTFYLPLLVVVSLSVFLGAWLGSRHFYIGFALLKGLRELILYLLQFYISVFLVNELTVTFNGEKDIMAARKLVAYSVAPLLLTSIITGIFPALYIVNVAGVYGVYIFWEGVKKIMVIEQSKQTNYILVSLFLCLMVFGFLSILLWKIFIGLY